MIGLYGSKIGERGGTVNEQFLASAFWNGNGIKKIETLLTM